MYRIIPLFIMSVISFNVVSCKSSESDESAFKPRLVVLTDIAPANVEPDDMESLIRLLVHADLFEIEAIITTSGWNSSGGLYNINWKDSVMNVISAYEKDLPNLMKRSGQTAFKSLDEEMKKQEIGYWPSPEYLRSITMMGSRDFGTKVLGKNNDSAGSDYIIRLADEDDSRPLWIALWGGGNTVAQSLWKVSNERSKEETDRFLEKIYIYAITDQDVAWGDRGKYTLSSHYWMRKTFGDKLNFIWDESAWLSQCALGASGWDDYARHIQNHGALGKIYPKNKYGVEGDTPSFLYVIPNGLNVPTMPSYGGWGGFFAKSKTLDNETYCYTNTDSIVKSVSKSYENYFYPDIFNNFASRMDWAEYGCGNCNPIVIVNGYTGFNAVEINVNAGEEITLDASESYDSDGDVLSFKWWHFVEAGTYSENVIISDYDGKISKINVPSDAKGKTIHIICEVTDDGSPCLKGYKRIILKVGK